MFVRTERVVSILLIVIGIGIALYSRRLVYFSEFGPGPGFLPTWLGIAIALMSVMITIQNVIKERKVRSEEGQEKNPINNGISRKVLKVVIALGASLLIFEILGFALTIFILLSYLLHGVESYSLKYSIIFAGLSSSAFYLIFKVGLSVPLPIGIFGF